MLRLRTCWQPEGWLGALIKAAAFVKKDMKIALSYRLQFAFQFLQILFSVAIIYFIGKIVGESGRSSLLRKYGTDYFSFALVGLAVSSYVRAGLERITNEVRQIMNQGVLEALCAPPVNYSWLLLCTSLWEFIFETIRVGFYFCVAVAIFGMKLQRANWPLAVVSLILTVSIFLMLGMMSCSLLIIVKRGDPIYWFLSRAATLLAGTMFPISVFPRWLRIVACGFPLTHSLEVARKCLLAGAPLKEVSGNITALLGFACVLLPVTILVNSACMKRAKQSGAFTLH